MHSKQEGKKRSFLGERTKSIVKSTGYVRRPFRTPHPPHLLLLQAFSFLKGLFPANGRYLELGYVLNNDLTEIDESFNRNGVVIVRHHSLLGLRILFRVR